MAPDDYDLIPHAKQGDVSAFEQLIYRYDQHVFAIAARFGNSTNDAKDIYQEVFLRVFRGLKNFQERSEFTTWLYRITTNVCLTHQSHKKKRTHVSLSESDNQEQGAIDPVAQGHESNPEQQTVASDISMHVQEALRSLSPKQKMVFTLRHDEGYKLKEIASMMNCTEGTVKRHLFTATRRMREQLKDVY